MNSKDLNSKVIDVLKNKLPEGVNMMHFLTDVLPLGKEAVYRRMRGDVMFSFSEIYLIAQKLKISLDYFANPASDNSIIFELIQQEYSFVKEDMYSDLKGYNQIIDYVGEDEYSLFELSHNLFPQLPTHLFYNLSKYISFKWTYLNQNLYRIKPFKDLEYSQDVYLKHKNGNLDSMKIKNTSYIWDYTIVKSIVNEIKYFKAIDLLDEEDVSVLKGELHEFLDYVENLAKTGMYPTGNKLNIYISSIHSDATYSYFEAKDLRVCIIGILDFHYIISADKKAFDKMKEKISSLKRVSTLISGSGEAYRISFFNHQHELVDTLC